MITDLFLRGGSGYPHLKGPIGAWANRMLGHVNVPVLGLKRVDAIVPQVRVYTSCAVRDALIDRITKVYRRCSWNWASSCCA